jgi:hypothetical protein
MSDSTLKITRWGLCGVGISLLPLFYSYESLVIRSEVATWDKVVGNGELLVIVWALCAGAIGELFGSSANYRASKIIAGAASLIVLILSALLFADIAQARATGTKINETALVSISIWLLFWGLLSCGSCVALSDT